MSRRKMTHVGIIVGVDARVPRSYQEKILLRETKNFWVSQHGLKYRKSDGYRPGSWPMYKLLLDSIKPLEEE